jgi:hypothetical protein
VPLGKLDNRDEQASKENGAHRGQTALPVALGSQDLQDPEAPQESQVIQGIQDHQGRLDLEAH